MRSEDLLRYIGDVEPRFIEELFEEPVSARRTHGRRKGVMRLIAACLAVVILGTGVMLATIGGTGFDSVILGGGGLSSQLHMKSNSIVMIDVNPSIQFEVNDRDTVVKYKALNDDAEKLGLKFDVVGKDYDTAIEITLKALKEAGYISGLKNSVLITVLDKDEKRALEIRDESAATVDLVDDALDLSISLLSQIMCGDDECRELAKEYKVSSGKIALIEKICEANSDRKDLNVATLAGSSIQSINQLLQFLTAPENVQIIGTVAGAVPEKYLREIGIEDMDTEELINLVEAAADFSTSSARYTPRRTWQRTTATSCRYRRTPSPRAETPGTLSRRVRTDTAAVRVPR